MSNSEKIKTILEKFEPYDKIYKREAVDEAIALKDDITPHLIEILEDVLANPDDYVDSPVETHIYAFMLLGYFKEPKAHESLIKLFSLPEDYIDPLFGDLITEDLPMVLFNTCGGSVDQIKSLIVNKESYEYCRGSALSALTYAVAEGMVSREETLDFLGTLFTGEEDDNPDSGFWTFVVDAISDLYPEELMPTIEQAFQNEMVDEMFFGLDEIKSILDQGKEQTLEKLRDKMKMNSLDDIHKSMAWWAMFDYQSERSAQIAMSAQKPAKPKTVKQIKAKKKKKRKQAKVSKKKNRRR